MAEKWNYDRNELLNLYIDKEMSILSIAKFKQVSYKAVRNALVREGVVLRANNTVGLHNHSEETKNKIRQSKLGEKNPNWQAASVTEKTKLLLQKAGLGRKHSLQTKTKMSQTRIENGLSVGARNPMKREECVRRWIASNRINPNKQELKLCAILEEVCPKKYGINTRAEILILDGAIPDFVSIDNTKKIIELFGDYWHRGQDGQNRIDRFAKLGYQTLIVWQKELADVEELKRKVIVFNEIR